MTQPREDDAKRLNATYKRYSLLDNPSQVMLFLTSIIAGLLGIMLHLSRVLLGCFRGD